MASANIRNTQRQLSGFTKDPSGSYGLSEIRKWVEGLSPEGACDSSLLGYGSINENTDRILSKAAGFSS
jgi:hypothetical protein